jgi:hypothetical protein
MDTSKEYIKMCDCPEIQEHRKHDGGDWLCTPEDGHSWATWQKVHGKSEEEIRKFMDGLLWLPRQDQIQEMLGITSHSCITLANKFAEFCCTDGDESSMEQLWLAFYMYEEHKKVWDGKKWGKKSGE